MLYLNGMVDSSSYLGYNLFMQRGKYFRTEAIREKHRKNAKRDSEHHNWKGDDVGYIGIHTWVRSRLPKPLLCPVCKQRPPRDLANISQEYKRDITDFEWLCRSCHIIKEGRRNNKPPYKMTEEGKRNISNSLKGIKFTEEHKNKLSLIAKKRYLLREINQRGQFI